MSPCVCSVTDDETTAHEPLGECVTDALFSHFDVSRDLLGTFRFWDVDENEGEI